MKGLGPGVRTQCLLALTKGYFADEVDLKSAVVCPC